MTPECTVSQFRGSSYDARRMIAMSWGCVLHVANEGVSRVEDAERDDAGRAAVAELLIPVSLHVAAFSRRRDCTKGRPRAIAREQPEPRSYAALTGWPMAATKIRGGCCNKGRMREPCVLPESLACPL